MVHFPARHGADDTGGYHSISTAWFSAGFPVLGLWKNPQYTLSSIIPEPIINQQWLEIPSCSIIPYNIIPYICMYIYIYVWVCIYIYICLMTGGYSDIGYIGWTKGMAVVRSGCAPRRSSPRHLLRRLGQRAILIMDGKICWKTWENVGKYLKRLENVWENMGKKRGKICQNYEIHINGVISDHAHPLFIHVLRWSGSRDGGFGELTKFLGVSYYDSDEWNEYGS